MFGGSSFGSVAFGGILATSTPTPPTSQTWTQETLQSASYSQETLQTASWTQESLVTL